MLTRTDGSEYEALKARVQVGMDAMLDACAAAEEIKSRGLYQLEYDSWDDFYQAEFGKSSSHLSDA